MRTELFNNGELFQSVNRTVSVWPTKPGAGHSWHPCPLASLWSFIYPNHMFLEITFRQSIWRTSIPWNVSSIIEPCFHSVRLRHSLLSATIMNIPKEWTSNTGVLCFFSPSTPTPKQSFRVLIRIFWKTSWDDNGNPAKQQNDLRVEKTSSGYLRMSSTEGSCSGLGNHGGESFLLSLRMQSWKGDLP